MAAEYDSGPIHLLLTDVLTRHIRRGLALALPGATEEISSRASFVPGPGAAEPLLALRVSGPVVDGGQSYSHPDTFGFITSRRPPLPAPATLAGMSYHLLMGKGWPRLRTDEDRRDGHRWPLSIDWDEAFAAAVLELKAAVREGRKREESAR